MSIEVGMVAIYEVAGQEVTVVSYLMDGRALAVLYPGVLSSADARAFVRRFHRLPPVLRVVPAERRF